MNRELAPAQAGVAVGLPAGIVLAGIVMLTAGASPSGLILDALVALLLGGGIVGGMTAFIQHRRLHPSTGQEPAGWHDSPEDDGTQWYWSGTEWTDHSRPIPTAEHHSEQL